MSIHPSAVISRDAIIAPDAKIGPFCIITGKVKIGARTKLDSHVSVGSDYGIVEIGEDNHICSGAALGGLPQDIHYKNDPTKLVIGNKNVIREFATLNIGTVRGKGETRLGDDNLIMAYVHLGHDCQVGNHNIIVNSTQIAGHVQVDNHVTISGVCAVNQFVRIGSYTFIAGASSVHKDVIPYTICRGNYAVSAATNKIGLQRSGMTPENVENINRAVRIILKSTSTVAESLERVAKECQMTKEMEYLVNFVKNSKRGIAK
ncbi:MAG: acyl-ACP--UDP-N-acetylglucosamine O-acyltransferase [Bdellovibrionales bacterium]